LVAENGNRKYEINRKLELKDPVCPSGNVALTVLGEEPDEFVLAVA
jgi:hypothetical protein